MAKAEPDLGVRQPLEVTGRQLVRRPDLDVVRRRRHGVQEPGPLVDEHLRRRALGGPFVGLLQNDGRQPGPQLLLGRDEEPVGKGVGVEKVRVVDVGRPAVDAAPEPPRDELLGRLEHEPGALGRRLGVRFKREQARRRGPRLLQQRPVVRRVDLEHAEVQEVVLDGLDGQQALLVALAPDRLPPRRHPVGPDVAGVHLVHPGRVPVARRAEVDHRVDPAEVVALGLGPALVDGAGPAHRAASALGWPVGAGGAAGSAGGASPANNARMALPATNRPRTSRP